MVTLKEVSEEAGLSISTVSRILNNRGYISDQARASVERAMKKLNYQPNEVARSLSKQTSTMVALIVPHIRHPFFAVLISEIEEAVRKKGYQILLFNTKTEEDTLEKYLQICQQNRVSGVILCSARVKEDVLQRLNAPIITVERYSEMSACSVTCDNYNGGRMAAQHLYRCGCRNVLMFSGSSEMRMPADLRKNGFADACTDYGIACRETKIPEDAMNNGSYGQYLKEAADGWVSGQMKYDGIFISGDVMAAEYIQYAESIGIRIPEDVQVVGFDDTYVAELTTPGITTIHQPIREMAQNAAEMLVRAIADKETPSSVVLPVSLIRRGSTRLQEK